MCGSKDDPRGERAAARGGRGAAARLGAGALPLRRAAMGRRVYLHWRAAVHDRHARHADLPLAARAAADDLHGVCTFDERCSDGYR